MANSYTSLGQYGGPRTSVFGENSGDFLLDQIVVINNVMALSKQARSNPRAAEIYTQAIIANNVCYGGYITLLAATSSTPSVDMLNNGVFGTAASLGSGYIDKGGNFVTTKSYLIPNASSGDYRANRFAETEYGVNPSVVYAGQPVWSWDFTGNPVDSDNWHTGNIALSFPEITIPMSAGNTAELLPNNCKVSIRGGIAEFSIEPDNVFFGRGCVVSYYTPKLVGTEVQYSLVRAVIGTKSGRTGKRWTCTATDGTQSYNTGVVDQDGIYNEHISIASAKHWISDLGSELNSGRLATNLGFRSSGSLPVAKLWIDIVMYNARSYSSLQIGTILGTDKTHQIRIYAPNNYQTECVQPQSGDYSSSSSFGSGFKTSTRTAQGALVQMPGTAWITFENLVFKQVPKQAGEDDWKSSGIIGMSGAPVYATVKRCAFIGCTYGVILKSNCSAIANVMQSPVYGIEVYGDNVIVARNTIVNAKSFGIRSRPGRTPNTLMFNNVVTSVSGGNCITMSGSYYTSYSNMCSDASGTYEDGAPAPAITSSVFRNSVIGDYMPKPRDLLWNIKTVLSQHRYRFVVDYTRHTVTAAVSADHSPAQMPAWMLQDLFEIADDIMLDFYSHKAEGMDGYIGAIDFRAKQIHLSAGAVFVAMAGTLSALPYPVPAGSSETTIPSGLIRIEYSGTFNNLNALKPGMAIQTINGSVSTKYQLAERVTDTVWRVTDLYGNNYKPGASVPQVNNITSTWGAISNISCSPTSNPIAGAIGTTDFESSNISVNIHAIGTSIIGSAVNIRGLKTTAVNPIIISSGVGNPGDTSVIVSGSDYRGIFINFIGVHGATINGADFRGAKSTAVRFVDCAEPSVYNSYFYRFGTAIEVSGQTIKPVQVNNVFTDCEHAIELNDFGNMDAPSSTYGSGFAGVLGGDIEFRIYNNNAFAAIEELEAAKYLKINVVYAAATATPSISQPVFSAASGTITVTATFGASQTWLDLFNAVQSAYPTSCPGDIGPQWNDQGWASNGSNAGYGFKFCFKPAGQQTVIAKSFPGLMQIRDYTAPRRPMPIMAMSYGQAFYDGIKQGDYAGDVGEPVSALVSHNTFSGCKIAIYSPKPASSGAYQSRIHIINNNFHSCIKDAPVNIDLDTNGLSWDMKHDISIITGNTSSSKRLSYEVMSKSPDQQGMFTTMSRSRNTVRSPMKTCGQSLIGLGLSRSTLYENCRAISLYYGGTHFLYNYATGFEPAHRVTAAIMSLGRPSSIPMLDITGRARMWHAGDSGAVTASATAGTASVLIGTVSPDYGVDSAFTGYDIIYKLVHGTGHNFYDEHGVFDAVVMDGSSFAMNNLAVITEHMVTTKFLRQVRILVEPCEYAYTIGQPSTDTDLESRLVADDLVNDPTNPNSTAVSARYPHYDGEVEVDWFSRHLSSMASLKPAFCGCLSFYEEFPTGFTLIIETDPELIGDGVGVIIGSGTLDSNAASSPSKIRDQSIHSNDHQRRVYSAISPTTPINGSEGYVQPALVINAGAPNPYNLIIRNIRLGMIDSWPWSSSASTIDYQPVMIKADGAESIQIHDNELHYFFGLLATGMTIAPAAPNLREVSVVNNSVVQYDVSSEKSGVTVFGQDIMTDGSDTIVAMFPGIDTGTGGVVDMKRSYVQSASAAGMTKFVIANNDIMAYNAGIASINEADKVSKFTFIQRFVPGSAPGDDGYFDVFMAGNRMVHPCATQPNGIGFGFDSNVSFPRLDYSSGASSASTLVESPEVFGDGVDPSLVIGGKRVSAVDIEKYFIGDRSADTRLMQKFATIDERPSVASSSYLNGLTSDPVYKYIDTTPTVDIIGKPRFHGDSIVDIGAFYISSTETVFDRNNISSMQQITISNNMDGNGGYRIGGTNKIFKKIAKDPGYTNGTKVLIKIKSSSSVISTVSYKPKQVVAVFYESLYDSEANMLIMPHGGYSDIAMTNNLSGHFIDQLFVGVGVGRYILEYNYSKSMIVVYANPYHGLGCTGDSSVLDQARYSENRIAV